MRKQGHAKKKDAKKLQWIPQLASLSSSFTATSALKVTSGPSFRAGPSEVHAVLKQCCFPPPWLWSHLTLISHAGRLNLTSWHAPMTSNNPVSNSEKGLKKWSPTRHPLHLSLSTGEQCGASLCLEAYVSSCSLKYLQEQLLLRMPLKYILKYGNGFKALVSKIRQMS